MSHNSEVIKEVHVSPRSKMLEKAARDFDVLWRVDAAAGWNVIGNLARPDQALALARLLGDIHWHQEESEQLPNEVAP